MNESIPTDDDLDRLRAELGEGCDLTAEELDLVIESMAWSETPLVEPSADLKQRVMDSLPQMEDSQPRLWVAAADQSASQKAGFRWVSALPWAAALAIGLGLIYSAFQNSELNDVVDIQETKLKNLTQKNGVLLAEIERFEKGRELDQLKIVALQSELDTAYFGAAVWDAESETGMLQVARIPMLEAGKDYQLWIVDPQYKTPVDGGVFQVDAGGAATIKFKPSLKIDNVAAFAVSLEKKGGVPVAEGPMVLVGAL